jgi:predicted site-specific integrase-resolvase
VGPHLPPPAVPSARPGVAAIYARVSSAEHTSNRDSQAARLSADCAARGSHVRRGVHEGRPRGASQRGVPEGRSGVDDARPQVLALLADPGSGLIMVEHTDRLTRVLASALWTRCSATSTARVKWCRRRTMARRMCWLS